MASSPVYSAIFNAQDHLRDTSTLEDLKASLQILFDSPNISGASDNLLGCRLEMDGEAEDPWTSDLGATGVAPISTKANFVSSSQSKTLGALSIKDYRLFRVYNTLSDVARIFELLKGSSYLDSNYVYKYLLSSCEYEIGTAQYLVRKVDLDMRWDQLKEKMRGDGLPIKDPEGTFSDPMYYHSLSESPRTSRKTSMDTLLQDDLEGFFSNSLHHRPTHSPSSRSPRGSCSVKLQEDIGDDSFSNDVQSRQGSSRRARSEYDFHDNNETEEVDYPKSPQWCSTM